MIARAALALLLALTALARADEADEARADRAFRDAETRAAAGDHGAIDALEQLGAARPITRWTDDAWLEAGRLAARDGDYGRAHRDVEQAVATASDEQAARRARAELARIERAAGTHGEWDAVAAQHDTLEARVLRDADPKPALHELEQLVEKSPGYIRASTAMIAIAHGWQREGDAERALTWLERAVGVASIGQRVTANAELARALIGLRRLDDAREVIARIPAREIADELRRALHRAEWRERLRWIAWALLAAIVAAAVVALRRAAGTWRAAGRRLARPPAEVLYLAPVAVVIALVAQTGNPLIAGAVRAIVLAGVAVAWLSGAILDAVRARGGRIGLSRALAHGALAVAAVLSVTYLAVDRGGMIDLVVATWHAGPEAR